jgi:hypothetical protein
MRPTVPPHHHGQTILSSFTPEPASAPSDGVMRESREAISARNAGGAWQSRLEPISRYYLNPPKDRYLIKAAQVACEAVAGSTGSTEDPARSLRRLGDLACG